MDGRTTFVPHLGLGSNSPADCGAPIPLGARCSRGLIVPVADPQGSVVAIAAGRRRTIA